MYNFLTNCDIKYIMQCMQLNPQKNMVVDTSGG